MADPNQWDEKKALSLIGKYALVGITELEADEETIIRRQEFHGVIVSADKEHGFSIRCGGEFNGQIKWLPPSTDAFFEADPGEYRIKSSGEIVSGPDVTAIWTVTKPKN